MGLDQGPENKAPKLWMVFMLLKTHRGKNNNYVTETGRILKLSHGNQTVIKILL